MSRTTVAKYVPHIQGTRLSGSRQNTSEAAAYVAHVSTTPMLDVLAASHRTTAVVTAACTEINVPESLEMNPTSKWADISARHFGVVRRAFERRPYECGVSGPALEPLLIRRPR